MNKLQKFGAVTAFLEAAIYVFMFAFFGAYWKYPADAAVVEKLKYLSDHVTVLYCVNLVGFVLFGLALSVVVLAIHERLKHLSPLLVRAASLFGVLWVGLVTAAGMIANVGLVAAVEKAGTAPEQALSLFSALNYVVEGIGGGNEIVGGLWVLMLSVAAMNGGLSKALAYFGILVGAMGVATTYPAEVLKEMFGLSQIVWFVWLGCALLRTTDSTMDRADDVQGAKALGAAIDEA